MNSLQYGLQTGHVISDFSLQKHPAYEEWAAKHKTIIICDALNLAGLKRVNNLLSDFTAMLAVSGFIFIPHGFFHEDEDALGGIMTCVGVVIPEQIYDFPDHHPDSKYLDILQTKSFRKVIEEYEFASANFHAQELNVDRIKFLTYCLLKSYNLAPR
jgi:hypothetical protein